MIINIFKICLFTAVFNGIVEAKSEIFAAKETSLFICPVKNSTDIKQVAADKLVLSEAVAFYKFITEGNFESAVGFLHPLALKATPKADWIKLLSSTKAQFGKLLKTEMVDSRKFDQVKTAVGKGDFYQILFKNTYEKGVLYEMLSFVKENGVDKLRMLSYSYNSNKSKMAFEVF